MPIPKSVQNKIKKYYQNKKIQEKYRKMNQTKKQIGAYIKLGKEDTIYQIINNLSTRLCAELKEKNVERELTYSEFLGCTYELRSCRYAPHMSFAHVATLHI